MDNKPANCYSCDDFIKGDFIKVNTEVFDKKLVTHDFPLIRPGRYEHFASWLQYKLHSRSMERNSVSDLINRLLQVLETGYIGFNIAGVVGIFMFDGSYAKADDSYAKADDSYGKADDSYAEANICKHLSFCYVNAALILDTYNASKSPEDKKSLHDAVEDATSAVMKKTLVKLHEEIQDRWRKPRSSGFFNR